MKSHFEKLKFERDHQEAFCDWDFLYMMHNHGDEDDALYELPYEDFLEAIGMNKKQFNKLLDRVRYKKKGEQNI